MHPQDLGFILGKSRRPLPDDFRGLTGLYSTSKSEGTPSHLKALPDACYNAMPLSCCPCSCSDLQMHGGPVDGVLPGDPREESLSGHEVVPALL